MFEGIYDLIKKSKKNTLSEKVLIHKDPSPILAADILLSTKKRQDNMSEIKSLLNLPDEEYQRIFLVTTENFAQFVQNLPETERSYYAEIGGMLDHALERAALSLFLCRTYLLPEDVTLASASETEMIWVYAVYSAALLYDIGKIATSHIITLTDETGNTIKSWLPFTGPMTESAASHYAYEFSKEHNDNMRWMVTTLLARQILPAECFYWLASEPEVFEAWLLLLSDGERKVGSLLTVVRLADAQLLETFFTDKKIFRNNLSPQILASLAKIQKDSKELRDKKTKDYLNKEENNKKINNQAELKSEEKKSLQQSIFAVPSVLAEDKLNPAKIPTAYALAETGKDIAGKIDTNKMLGTLTDYLKKKIALQNMSGNTDNISIRHTDKGIILDQNIIQAFIQDNKIPLNAEQFKQLLANIQLANPVTVLLQTGQAIPAVMLTLNPYIYFPSGPPPMMPGAMFQVIPAAGAAHEVRPHVQTAQQTYQEEQKTIEKQPQKEQGFHTPRPTIYPGSS